MLRDTDQEYDDLIDLLDFVRQTCDGTLTQKHRETIAGVLDDRTPERQWHLTP